jgi:hypothetical protein
MGAWRRVVVCYGVLGVRSGVCKTHCQVLLAVSSLQVESNTIGDSASAGSDARLL